MTASLRKEWGGRYIKFQIMVIVFALCMCNLIFLTSLEECMLYPSHMPKHIIISSNYLFHKENMKSIQCSLVIIFFKIKANDKTVHTLDAPNNKGTKINANQTKTNKLIIEENTTTNLEQFSGVLKESRILLRLKLERRHFR